MTPITIHLIAQVPPIEGERGPGLIITRCEESDAIGIVAIRSVFTITELAELTRDLNAWFARFGREQRIGLTPAE